MDRQPIDIARLHAAYAAGLDVMDVIDTVLETIEAVDDPGIFISRVPREELRAAARALGPFDPVGKPLWGVPFAVKDNIDVAGMPTTAACPAFAFTPQIHAPAVARALAAGAILVGKTNLDQFATGLVGVRTPYPVPRNAVDPRLVPGGSSSGSAVAVAHGIVAFALGTDTAGSGRVPAAFNNIVGLKPSVGAIPTRGVFPACRSLDCVSVFALTVEDAYTVYLALAGTDAADPYSRPVTLGPAAAAPKLRIGIPEPAKRRFCGDPLSEKAYSDSLALLESLGHTLVPIDPEPLHAVADLLYAGPWVAERYADFGRFLEEHPDEVDATVRKIILTAKGRTAIDAFAGFHRLAELRAATRPMWAAIDVLAVPSTPTVTTLADIAADPLEANFRLGHYTNFVNLLDLCALAVPGPFRSDGRPAGVTLIGERGTDGVLAGLGAELHRAATLTLGATGLPLPPAGSPPAAAGLIEIAVVGAHMSGMPLNRELTELGALFVRTTQTAAEYRLYALEGSVPRPGLLRVAAEDGAPIAVEVWAMSAAGFGRFVAGIKAPLGIGTLALADGTAPKGFLVEAAAIAGAPDITRFGGWRAYLEAAAAA